MNKLRIFFTLLILILKLDLLYAGDTLRTKIYPWSVSTLQFAGSTGLVTAGFSKASRNYITEIGLQYGYLPRIAGGTIHSLSLKFTYSPFKIIASKKFEIIPFQAGLFFCQNFGENLGLRWTKKYPKEYYWWPRSLRTHCFTGLQVSYKMTSKRINKISYFLEANTNDLYILSIANNTETMSLYDIIFLGTGLKLYLK